MQGKQLTMLLAVLYGGAFLAGFNENLVNMGLIAIMDEFAIDSVTAQWLVTGFMIASTIIVMCMAFLYRRIRLRTLFFCRECPYFGRFGSGPFAQRILPCS